MQVQVAPGLPAFAIVGLPDKAVSEAHERVRSALIASGLALPARRITVNLAPADVPKEGSHYDLPIALGLMAAIGAIPPDALSGFTVLGELGSTDRSHRSQACCRRRSAPIRARRTDLPCGLRLGSGLGEPGHPDHRGKVADPDRQPFQGHAAAVAPAAEEVHERERRCSICATSRARKAPSARLEIAAAGGHHLLMIGSPGAGKSMLAARLPSILPPLSPSELLEVSMIASVAGEIHDGVDRATAVPQPASFGQHGAADRRRRARKRNLARASGRIVPRRIAGVRSACWIRCASRWKTARSRCPAPIIASPIRRASCWSRR
jgi:magnesium chelatase family protein